MVSKSKIILFATVSNILLINVIGFTQFLRAYKNASWIYLIVYIFISIIISLFFKSIPKEVGILKTINKKHLLRILISLYLIIMTSLLLILSSIIIKKFFYFYANITIIFTILLITSIIISIKGTKTIISVGAFCFFIMLFFYLVPILHIYERDFSLLLPLQFDPLDLFKSIILFIFPLDNILLVLSHDIIKDGCKKSVFCLSNIFSGVYLLFIICDGITLTGANFYTDLRYGGLLHWQLFQGNKFIENFDFFLLIILTTTTIFRLAYYFDTLKKVLNFKKIKLYPILVGAFFLIIFIIGFNYLNYLSIISKYLIYSSVILIFIIYIMFCFLSHKLGKQGVKNE